ncbi:hypothetical protein FRC00_014576 [Tulasnella sp. 408]|nr:hypothetical protein FRC00_014576 [Tulasnella sp. 408]
MQEREDIAQELDAERQRSRTAEAKAAAADAKYSEMQAEILRLRDELEQAHASRSDFSAILIQDARARLEGLQNSLGLNEQPDAEVTRILENLVADNEAIKRDNAELQNMLTESREELRVAHDELAELQATAALAPSPIPPTPSPRAAKQQQRRQRMGSPCYRADQHEGASISRQLGVHRAPVSVLQASFVADVLINRLSLEKGIGDRYGSQEVSKHRLNFGSEAIYRMFISFLVWTATNVLRSRLAIEALHLLKVSPRPP